METMIVEIVIGATGEVIDFIVPAHVHISAIIPEIIRLLEQTRQELLFDRETPLLFDESAKNILSSSATLAQCGVRNGRRLMIV